MANVLVTGGCGFIGSHLVEALVGKGHQVRVLDNLSRGKKEYLQPLIGAGEVEFVQGDVRDLETVKRAVQGMEYVFHEASDNINKSRQQPAESIAINLQGSANVFQAA